MNKPYKNMPAGYACNLLGYGFTFTLDGDLTVVHPGPVERFFDLNDLRGFMMIFGSCSMSMGEDGVLNIILPY